MKRRSLWREPKGPALWRRYNKADVKDERSRPRVPFNEMRIAGRSEQHEYDGIGYEH